MASVSSVSASDYAYSQLQAQQAKAAADRAEATARALKSKAGEAQDKADQEQENARSLKVQSDAAQQNAGSARQNVQTLQSVRQLQSGFTDIRQQIASSTATSDSTAGASTAVINSQGQTTGTQINVTA